MPLLQSELEVELNFGRVQSPQNIATYLRVCRSTSTTLFNQTLLFEEFMIRYESKNGDLAKQKKQKRCFKKSELHPQNLLRTLYLIELSVKCSSRWNQGFNPKPQVYENWHKITQVFLILTLPYIKSSAGLLKTSFLACPTRLGGSS